MATHSRRRWGVAWTCRSVFGLVFAAVGAAVIVTRIQAAHMEAKRRATEAPSIALSLKNIAHGATSSKALLPRPSPTPNTSTATYPPAFFSKARSCLLDSPHLTDPSVLPLRPLAKQELQAHYQQLLVDLLPLRTGIPMFKNNQYRGPWIENWWISTFYNRSLEEFGYVVPIFGQWSDLLVQRGTVNYSSTVLWMLSRLRKDVLYVTVVQSDTGLYPIKEVEKKVPVPRVPFDSTLNILVLSAGGTGHVPVPLLQKELKPASRPPQLYNVTFSGMVYYARKTVVQAMWRVAHDYPNIAVYHEIMSGVFIKANESKTFNMGRNVHGQNWQYLMRATLINLAPRGFGRTSYRLFEQIQMGLAPVYIYDDEPWFPYRDTPASVNGSLGWVVKADDMYDWLVGVLNSTSIVSQVREREERIALYRESHFSFPGVMNQIKIFLSGDSNAHLKCQRHPVKIR